MKEKGDFHEIHPTRLSSFSRYPCNETFREKIKEEAAATEKQKGKCGIKQLGVLWVGTPIDEAKVDLSVLRPVPLVRHLKYATHHPLLSLLKYFFFRLHGCCPCDLESCQLDREPQVRASGGARASVRAPSEFKLAATLLWRRLFSDRSKCPVAQVP